MPLSLFLLFVAWGFASFYVFKRDCLSVPNSTFFLAPAARPMSFKVNYHNKNSFTAHSFGWPAAIESGIFEFVDTDVRRECLDEYHVRVSSCDRYAGISSEFTVEVLPEKRVNYWWLPPLYSVEIRITQNPSGKIIARANDLVFGGGLAGLYMRIIGNDQDYTRLSCGYASPDIGPWRPTLTSRKRFAEYQNADVAFVSNALSPRRSN